ncbi:uncharacterized protein LOC135499661 [Lineus longissimus]|uniref:uncharacterized protein LOC135499661 n=1 Tax=Lineus longissimus TaxID=88925 RepID=UPI00315C603F
MIHFASVFGVKMSQVNILRFVAWSSLSPNLILRVRTPLSQAHQVKNNKCFAQPFRSLELCTKNVDASGLVLAKNIAGSFCPVCSISSSILTPKVMSVPAILSNSRNFCTNSPPYDPEKDAFLQDILKEFGRDFSSDIKNSNDGVSGEVDSGYESDSDTNLKKSADSSSSSSSSDSDSDLDDKSSSSESQRLSDREWDAGKWSQRGQLLEPVVKEDGPGKFEEAGALSAEVKDNTLDDYEEIEAYSDENEEVEEIYERVHVIQLERGETGVFDIDELVAVLRDENAIDLIVMAVPKRFNYVDYMVVASGRSVRHIRAMAEYFKFLHKKKKGKKDHYLKIEGLDAKDWVAMDFGNIALHLFMPAMREIYDLESLWALGGQYDKQTKQQDDAYAFLFDQQAAVPGVSKDLDQSSPTAFNSDPKQQVSDGGEKDSYEMHSDQWHQVETTNFENKTDVER